MRVLFAFLMACLLVIPQGGLPSAQAQALDYDIPGGHFFKQTNGRNGEGTTGFAVLDDNQAKFWTEFNRLGGLQVVGYPISQRFVWDGFVSQAFQKVVMQWRPEVGQAYFVNVFDQLAVAGKDPWLEAFRQTPPSLDHSADAGLSWGSVVARHLALLDANAAIKARYLADSDPVLHFGLPMSSKDYGNVFVVRAQRVVIQQWKVDVPWAAAGQVVIANGGDVANEAGLLPASALVPRGEPGRDELPDGVNDALAAIRQQLRVADPADLRLIAWEAVEWPNGCLGLNIRNTLCTQVITPGYRLIVEVRNRGGTFEYRTNASGTLVLPASAPPTGIEAPALTWEGTAPGDGICRTLALAPNGEALVGLCGGAQVPLRLFADSTQLEELNYYRARFAPFSANTPEGEVRLFATGQEAAPEVWKEAVANWAQGTEASLRAGRVGRGTGEVLVWQAPGEVAGTCRNLRLHLSGRAYAGVTPCGTVDPAALSRYWLSTDDLSRLSFQTSNYESVNRQEGVTLVVTSTGTQPYTGAALVSLFTWVEQLYGRLTTQQSTP